jgi:hypothetical protein
MTKDSWIGLGIVAGVVLYFFAAAILGFHPVNGLFRIVGAIPILILLFLAPFGAVAMLGSIFRRR